MKRSRQYTIRNVPARLDELVRQRAEEEGKSINEVALEALARGMDLDKVVESSAFDGLSGTWVEDPACEEALDEMRGKIDWEIWK